MASLADGLSALGQAVVDVVRGQQADAAVAVLAVVPVEEVAAMGAGCAARSRSAREIWPVFERLELAFGVRIVVGYLRSRVALRDAQRGVTGSRSATSSTAHGRRES